MPALTRGRVGKSRTSLGLVGPGHSGTKLDSINQEQAAGRAYQALEACGCQLWGRHGLQVVPEEHSAAESECRDDTRDESLTKRVYCTAWRRAVGERMNEASHSLDTTQHERLDKWDVVRRER